MTTTQNDVDVLVIGAGLAGLTAAATAERAGAGRVLVLEGQEPGGRARVTERDGFTFNLGAHALYVGGEAMDVLGRLGIRPQGSPPPLDRLHLLRDGRLHRLPSGPGSLLRTTALSARSKVALGKLLARLPRFDPSTFAGRSVEDWLAELDLRDDATGVLRGILRTATYADDFGVFDAGAAVQQLQRAAAKGVVYLDGGWAQLIDGLRRHVEVRTGIKVRRIADAGTVETDHGTFRARTVVLAAGTPAAAALVLPEGAPTWGDVGDPIHAAALDVGVRGVPTPGYVLGVDAPVYGTTQSPPARQAPSGSSVVAVLRYGTRNATDDRAELEGWLPHVGVREGDVVTSRFLARMAVVGAAPQARNGGLDGRATIDDAGVEGVLLAGDWVGRHGHLADAAFASGEDAGRAAARRAAAAPATMAR
jgi:glycine/D-amino acid oxidase-like deaminating enzyme